MLVKYHDEDLFTKLKTPLSIGIVGESASGKSTITEDFVKALNEHNISTVRINTDDYYYDNSENIKKHGSFAAWAKTVDLDCPEAMELSLMMEHIDMLKNGQEVYLPKYDMSGTGIRTDNCIQAKPSDVIISEGLFTMCIKEVFDICIYVDIDKQVQKQRWYERAAFRNLGDAADFMYEMQDSRADLYIRPYKNICNVILSGEGPRPEYKKLMERVLSKCLLTQSM